MGKIACMQRHLSVRRFAVLVVVLAMAPRLSAVEKDPGPGRAIHLRMTTQTVAGDDKDGQQSAASAPSSVSVRRGKRVALASSPQRNPELSEQYIVIVGLNAEQQELWRSIQLDPRLLRGESDLLQGGSVAKLTAYHKDVEFVVTPPDSLPIQQIRIYKPRWTGVGYTLDLIAEATVERH